MVLVDEIPFPPRHMITSAASSSSKSLSLLGHGITDIEIHFLQIKFTAIGVYIDPEIVTHLQNWKGKTGTELIQDGSFFEALITAPVDKFVRIVVIKEIKGSQYGVQLESSVRDWLAADDKYEEEEEEALEKVIAFFQSKYFKKDSVITFSFPAAAAAAATTTSTDSSSEGAVPVVAAEIGFTAAAAAAEGKEESKIKVENANVVKMIQKWYLGGKDKGVSPTTTQSLATNLAALLL